MYRHRHCRHIKLPHVFNHNGQQELLYFLAGFKSYPRHFHASRSKPISTAAFIPRSVTNRSWIFSSTATLYLPRTQLSWNEDGRFWPPYMYTRSATITQTHTIRGPTCRAVQIVKVIQFALLMHLFCIIITPCFSFPHSCQGSSCGFPGLPFAWWYVQIRQLYMHSNKRYS